MNEYIQFNKDAWDNRVKNKNRYTLPMSHETFIQQLEQPLSVALTIGKSVPIEWFEKTKGKKILGLACGGGQQSAVFASHGYDVTIMDFSQEQLDNDVLVAKRENFKITTVQSDMTQPFPFDDESFDIIFCPVSNVFIQDLTNLWNECYRILRPEGLLMVGYMNPWAYMFDMDEVWDHPEITLTPKFTIPFDSVSLKEQGKIQIDSQYGYEFSHTLETQIGGQLRAGFAMIDFYESNDTSSRLSQYNSLYLANLSIKQRKINLNSTRSNRI